MSEARRLWERLEEAQSRIRELEAEYDRCNRESLEASKVYTQALESERAAHAEVRAALEAEQTAFAHLCVKLCDQERLEAELAAARPVLEACEELKIVAPRGLSTAYVPPEGMATLGRLLHAELARRAAAARGAK